MCEAVGGVPLAHNNQARMRGRDCERSAAIAGAGAQASERNVPGSDAIVVSAHGVLGEPDDSAALTIAEMGMDSAGGCGSGSAGVGKHGGGLGEMGVRLSHHAHCGRALGQVGAMMHKLGAEVVQLHGVRRHNVLAFGNNNVLVARLHNVLVGARHNVLVGALHHMPAVMIEMHRGAEITEKG